MEKFQRKYFIFISALQSLRQNLKRTILTMSGIVIGISSVITILSIGEGFREYSFKNFNQNSIKQNEFKFQIIFSPKSQGNINFNSYFTNDDLLIIKEMDEVIDVQLNENDSQEMYYEFKNIHSSFQTKIKFDKSSNVQLTSGRNYNIYDNESYSRVAVISKDVADKLGYEGILIEGNVYNIVGIFQKKTNEIQEPDIYIPQKTYKTYSSKNNIYNSITVSIKNRDKFNEISTNIIKVLSEIGSKSDFGTYEILDTSSLVSGVSNVLQGITLFISSIAGISLFIAGIGVMNMMYSMTIEKTLEIGIRRAIGATRRDIRNQFIFEGIVLTFIPGIIGCFFGFFIAYIISIFLPFSIVINYTYVILSSLIVIILGILFSFAPANTASKKQIIDIIR